MDISIFTHGITRVISSSQCRIYLIAILSATLLVWYGRFLWKRRNLYIYSWKVEGPLALPLIGCGFMTLGDMSVLVDMQQKISSNLVRVWLGPRLVYLISDPHHIEKILNHPKALDKEPVYKIISQDFGTGILTAPAEKWKRHRKLLAPAFSRTILDTFVEVFAEQGKIFADQLETVVGQKGIDFYVLASRCTLDIICQTAMGLNMNIQKEKGMYAAYLDRFMEILSIRLFRVWYHSDFVWSFSSYRKELKKAQKSLHSVTASVVSKKLAEHQKTMSSKDSSIEAQTEEEPVYKRLAFLDLILKNYTFTEIELRDEVDIFLAAGTETTATSTCCLFTMLGMHPEIQQKVYEEVTDVIGTDRTVAASDLPELKYTERVIKENLRLFPIVAIFGRAIGEDIDIGDAVLPAGSSVAFTTPYIHRNPKYWTDPLKFDPDRFLPEEMTKRHPCTFIPFSYGPRNCIGWKYAIANLKTIVATVIRRYRIFTEYKSVEEIDLIMKIVLRMKDGPKVWLEKR